MPTPEASNAALGPRLQAPAPGLAPDQRDSIRLSNPAAGLAAAMLLVLAAAGCGRQGVTDKGGDPGADAPAVKPLVAVSTAVVAPTDMEASVSLTGVLAPLPGAESRVAPAAPGRIRQVFVQGGQEVSRGQLVAELDPGPLAAQVRQAEAAVRAAEATVQQSGASYHSAVSVGASGVSSARTNVLAAQVALEKLLAGSRPEEIARAQSDVSAAAAAEANAEITLQRTNTLFAEGLVARKEVQAADLAVTTARSALRNARQDLLLKQSPNRPQDIAGARLAVQQAKDALAAAEASATQSSVRAGDIAIGQAQLHSAEAALQAARAQLANQFVRAPMSGTVVVRSANAGEYVDTTGSIVTIVDLRRVRLILQSPPSQASAIAAGEVVEFTPESQPDRTFHARVTLVGQAETPGTSSVPVEAVAENPAGRLRDDGFVRARVITAVHRGVLAVPAAAVVLLDGKPTVFVVDHKSTAHAHPVTQGIREGDRIEVLSGISAGDRIVTTGAYELDDGTRVRTADTGSAAKAGDPKSDSAVAGKD